MLRQKHVSSVADLGEGSPPPLFRVKKIAEGRKAGRASNLPPPSPLAQGLDPPLIFPGFLWTKAKRKLILGLVKAILRVFIFSRLFVYFSLSFFCSFVGLSTAFVPFR